MNRTPPKIVSLPERYYVGMRKETSLSTDNPIAQWQKFKPRSSEIQHTKSNGFYSIQVYPKELRFDSFSPETKFEKWAAVEVRAVEAIPEGMNSLVISEGKYAVFIHRGPMTTFQQTMQFIFSQWLPSSDFSLDDRPHFEFMDERYIGPMHPDSEEEVWVPIK